MMTKQIRELTQGVCIGIGLVSLVLGGSVVNPAAAQVEFSNESLQGRYALHYVAGPYVASGVGICEFDGKGAHFCDYIDSAPNPEKEFTRRIREIHADGNYTVNPDGTIQAVHRPTYADGRVIEYPYELTITDAETFGEYSIAEEISGYSSVSAEYASVLATVDFIKIPDIEFNNASLHGKYAAQYTVEPNIAQGIGFCDFDSNGTYACSFEDNSPNPENMQERRRSTIPISGTFTMESTGMVASISVQKEDGQEYQNPYNWVVTKAEVIGSHVVATELVGVSEKSAGEATDFMISVSLKRVSDD